MERLVKFIWWVLGVGVFVAWIWASVAWPRSPAEPRHGGEERTSCDFTWGEVAC